MRSVVKTGKTVDDAIALALKALDGAQMEDVTVEILEQPKAGFLGMFGGKEAIVRVTRKETDFQEMLRTEGLLDQNVDAARHDVDDEVAQETAPTSMEEVAEESLDSGNDDLAAGTEVVSSGIDASATVAPRTAGTVVGTDAHEGTTSGDAAASESVEGTTPSDVVASESAEGTPLSDDVTSESVDVTPLGTEEASEGSDADTALTHHTAHREDAIGVRADAGRHGAQDSVKAENAVAPPSVAHDVHTTTVSTPASAYQPIPRGQVQRDEAASGVQQSVSEERLSEADRLEEKGHQERSDSEQMPSEATEPQTKEKVASSASSDVPSATAQDEPKAHLSLSDLIRQQVGSESNGDGVAHVQEVAREPESHSMQNASLAHDHSLNIESSSVDHSPSDVSTSSAEDVGRDADVSSAVQSRHGAKTITSDEEALAFCREWLAQTLDMMHIEADITAEMDGDNIQMELINITDTDMGIVIGRRAETLNAIQYLCGVSLNRLSKRHYRVHLDVGGYRNRRKQNITMLAERNAEKAVRYHKAMKLEPMNAYERHIVHTALQGFEHVETISEGREPHRRVVIVYKD